MIFVSKDAKYCVDVGFGREVNQTRGIYGLRREGEHKKNS